MVCHSNENVKYAPLYLHTFRLPKAQPPALASTASVADKLRHNRLRKGLLQREVAEYLGIERTTYTAYEEDRRDYYPFSFLDNISSLFNINVHDLLDEYNAFLHNGQALQLKALREQMDLSQSDFATHFGVTKLQIKRWEKDEIRITKRFWQCIFFPSVD